MNKKISSILKKTAYIAMCGAVIGFAGAILPGAATDWSVSVKAAQEITINSTDVEIYALEDWEKEKISIPDNYPQSFQLVVSGASDATFRVTSNTGVIQVSEAGIITPKYTTYYYYRRGNYSFGTTVKYDDEEPYRIENELNFGTSNVRVTAGGKTFDVQVTLKDYGDTYVENVINDYVARNFKSSMTTEEKAEQCAKFAASYNYSASSSSAHGMIITGGGDCWASTDLIIRTAKKVGLDAWSRNGNRDAGAGSGHMNAMVSDGQEYYEVEAGYNEEAPRYYYVEKRESLFSTRYNSKYNGIEVYQYDGKEMPEELSVPDQILGTTVVAVGDKFIQSSRNVKKVTLPETIHFIGQSAFNSCYALEEINIPDSVEEIGTFAFTECRSLSKVANSGKGVYAFRDGMLLKNNTSLVAVPNAASVTIPSTVNKIEDYCFYYNRNIQQITVPAAVVSCGEGAFCTCNSLRSVTFQGNKLESLGKYAFAASKVGIVWLPSSVIELGEDIGHSSDLQIAGRTGTTLEEQAKLRNITFIDDSEPVNTSFVTAEKFNVGEKTLIYGKAVGGTKSYTFTYEYKKPDKNTWTSFGSGSVAAFKPGTSSYYDIRITATDKNGKASSKTIRVAARQESGQAISHVGDISAHDITVGEKVILKGEGAGGTSPYTYKYQYKKVGKTEWTTFGGSGDTAVFKPGAGDFTVMITVTDNDGRTQFQQYGVYVRAPKIPLENQSTISKESFNVGDYTVITAKAAGGTAPYTYSYKYRKAGSQNWNSFGSGKSAAFKPGSAGVFELMTEVKDSAGNTQRKTFNVTAKSASSQALTNQSVISSSTFNVGGKTVITAKASGGTAPYTFTYQYRKQGKSTWTSFGTGTSAAFKPGAAAKYDIKVTVTDADGKTAEKDFTITVK